MSHVGQVGLSSECVSELQGVRGKMLNLRKQADDAIDRADNLNKELIETQETLLKTEEERNSLQRQNINLNDQLYNTENLLKEANNKLSEADMGRESLLSEVKGLNHKLNTMDAAEESFKGAILESNERAQRAEQEAEEFKRSTNRLQMDADKLENDYVAVRHSEALLRQQLKEAEDRINELASSYNQVARDNAQLERNQNQHRGRPEPVSASMPINAGTTAQVDGPPITQDKYNLAMQNLQKRNQELADKERFLEDRLRDMDSYTVEWQKKDNIISRLENEVEVYQKNHQILQEQLHQSESNRRMIEKLMNSAENSNDQLTNTQEELKVLNKQLTESENRCAEGETQVAQMTAYVEQLEKDLHEQKVSYGQLCNKMNETIKDIQSSELAGGSSDL